MLNHITLMGRLTRDPEVRYTQSGTAVASFSLAVERDFSSRETGEKQTDFIDITAWRQTAEFVGKYFAKGALVAVSGRLQMRDWTDKDGNKRRNAEVVADNVYFAESKKSREGGSAPANTAPYNTPSGGYTPSYDSAPAANAFAELDEDDGELPF